MNDDFELERQARTAKLCERTLVLWKAGLDTTAIALQIDIAESTVCNIVHAWFDLRWQGRRSYMLQGSRS